VTATQGSRRRPAISRPAGDPRDPLPQSLDRRGLLAAHRGALHAIPTSGTDRRHGQPAVPGRDDVRRLRQPRSRPVIHRLDPTADIDETLGALSDLVRSAHSAPRRSPRLRSSRLNGPPSAAAASGSAPSSPPNPSSLARGRVRRAADLPATRDGRPDLQPAGRRLALRQVPQRPASSISRPTWPPTRSTSPTTCSTHRRDRRTRGHDQRHRQYVDEPRADRRSPRRMAGTARLSAARLDTCQIPRMSERA
jgi:hypothetical protein